MVDKEKCKACGQCVEACPHHLIELVPYEQMRKVRCSSLDKGKSTMNACDSGCIGCKKCEKNCPVHAITVTDNVAHIDYDKCTNCGQCKETARETAYCKIKKRTHSKRVMERRYLSICNSSNHRGEDGILPIFMQVQTNGLVHL